MLFRAIKFWVSALLGVLLRRFLGCFLRCWTCLNFPLDLKVNLEGNFLGISRFLPKKLIFPALLFNGTSAKKGGSVKTGFLDVEKINNKQPKTVNSKQHFHK